MGSDSLNSATMVPEEMNAVVTDDKVWENLVRWVEKEGGHVHPSLHLDGSGPSRGVFTSKLIEKGELLIRLPSSCVISGCNLPKGNADDSASTWLKCVGAYMKAFTEGGQYWKSYFSSLPKGEYETLFHWSDDEINNYLSGTALGDMVKSDRKHNSMENRYRKSIRPYLEKVGIVTSIVANDSSEEKREFDTFLEASMCISTRGFHLSKPNESENGQTMSSVDNGMNDDYCGPFLLPVIDLLNHDPKQSCTTLQRDSQSGVFYMVAERPLDANEEVKHSYGSSLTSAQLLQTFGFVPSDSSAFIQNCKICNCLGRSLTPACLSKISHMLVACKSVKASNYSQELQSWMKSQEMEQDEVWDISSIPERPLEKQISEDLLLTISDDSDDKSFVSKEMITLVCLQFLPEEAYEEVCTNDEIMMWLDESILEDYYLGKLVCKTLLEAIQLKTKDYEIVDDNLTDSIVTDIETVIDHDKSRLKSISALPLDKKAASNVSRPVYGLTVRLEEMHTLAVLKAEVMEIMQSLEKGSSVVYGNGSSKRQKVSE